MSQEKSNFAPLDWEKLPWEQTPYQGVFIHKVEEKLDPLNPGIPLSTVMALKLNPNAIIPLHRHNREAGWAETIILPNGGWFETKSDQESKEINTKDSITIIIKAGEIFGLKNIHPSKPLYFFSRMQPGFTGYGEIEEVTEETLRKSLILRS